ncbi:MAG: xanthine dehydrogenase subunit XdhA [Desulfobacteraceae bacterium]|jgi:xanthine dehydrogenase molybdenum-binding subunit|nr:xanthine dehydrogenase subunit XdhA [Desulfobacteraceae bacterium]
MAIGKSVQRVDGVAKVTGKARYTDDFSMPGMRVAKYLRSSIAHGRVVRIDTGQARGLPGVDGVFTYEDIPKKIFATAGHPFSLDPGHTDVADRRLLTDHIRYQGDEIAVVVAENELTAQKALALIDLEYESYRPLVRMDDVLAEDAPEIHNRTRNIVKEHAYTAGGDYEQAKKESDHLIEGCYETQVMQHCHLENHSAYAYMDDLEHIVIVTSTQIPHIVRRIVGEALELPLSQIRVIKPYVGGGFGNKQDVILEPMVAFLTLKLGGVPVKLKLDREEGMIGTRVRHPFRVQLELGVQKDGTVKFINFDALSNTGAYASHGHSIAAAAAAKAHYMYPRAVYRCHARTIYGNFPAAGAMRGYGSPQMTFAVDCAMEDAARTLGMDPVEFRIKNAVKPGDMNQIGKRPIMTAGLVECIEKGRRLIGWEKKRADRPSSQNGPVRRGLGLACFSYLSGTYPVCVEVASAALILNQDGSVHLRVGATEIGQGSDTAFAQMAAETLGIPFTRVHLVSTQDTDATPFDTGAYASRQTYVGGQAVMRTAQQLKEKILDYVGIITGMNPLDLDIMDGNIVVARTPGTAVMSLEDVAMDAYYDKNRGGQITAEVSYKTRTNAPSFGCTFVDLEVDVPMCKVKINEIYNVHDCGVVINPLNAEGQVYGGMAMGIGAGLFEALMIDPDSGRIYNNNMLDYKVPTIMDIPDLGAAFVETHEPTHPYGSKSLGEPPVLSPAPAIRNAILDATGVAVNELPLNPKTLFRYFKAAGLI